jgi:ABC-2 type transport system ATP-binding protein
MERELAIEVQDLERRFGTVRALAGVSFGVLRGEVLSLLGPNGAGKSTVISILCGLPRPSAGDTWMLGHSVTREPMAVKSVLGVVPQDLALYPDLTARENLPFWGRMCGLGGAVLRTRVDEVLELIGLADRQHGLVDTFSGGMKRCVNIGVALLHRPQVVIMDEPTVGIDPQSRLHILDAVKALNRQGMTLLYTTHYMEEAQELSAHIAIMDQGKVIAAGTHQDLVKIGFQQSSPGMIVMFAVFGVITSAMVLATERKTKTLQRMLTTPMRRAEVIGGHVLAMFLVGLVQQFLLVGVGQFVFGVEYLREPVGTLLLMVALALWVACLGLLIGATTRGEEQVVMWSLIAMFLFSALGGCWFPLEVAGDAFATIGHLMPTAWAMDGFQNIVVRGQGIEATLVPVTALMGYIVAFFAVALWRFKFA